MAIDFKTLIRLARTADPDDFLRSLNEYTTYRVTVEEKPDGLIIHVGALAEEIEFPCSEDDVWDVAAVMEAEIDELLEDDPDAIKDHMDSGDVLIWLDDDGVPQMRTIP